MKWSTLRDMILHAIKQALFPKDDSPAPAPLSPSRETVRETPETPQETPKSVPSWDTTVHASCWNGNNASERMMNVLSPKMADATFKARLAWMKGRGCDAAHVFLVNQGDGEASGYSPWGAGKAPNAGNCDATTVAHMKARIAALRAAGLAVVIWIVADDSNAWAKALFQNATGAMSALWKAGMFADASYVVLGLEMDEYGSSSQWTSLRDALRKTGYVGKIGVHHTSGKYPFLSLGDIVLDQLDPSNATPSAIVSSVKALRAKGKAVVGFEYSRGADRAKAQVALSAGAFAVGNW